MAELFSSQTVQNDERRCSSEKRQWREVQWQQSEKKKTQKGKLPQLGMSIYMDVYVCMFECDVSETQKPWGILSSCRLEHCQVVLFKETGANCCFWRMGKEPGMVRGGYVD